MKEENVRDLISDYIFWKFHNIVPIHIIFYTRHPCRIVNLKHVLYLFITITFFVL